MVPMSLQTTEEIKCPCGELFRSEVYQSVSAGDDPELKDLILGGEFNLVQCPACSEIIYAERFVLYHDQGQELMAFVYPLALKSNWEPIQAEMMAKYETIQDGLAEGEKLAYKPVLIFGMDQLCALITMDEEISDEAEIVQHLCKTLGLKSKAVPKSSARERLAPPVLPLIKESGNGGLREAVIAGVKKILQSNDRLAYYKKFLEKIQSDPNWKI